MITANELRIGNTIQWLHEESETIIIVTAEVISQIDHYNKNPDDDRYSRGVWWAPIPLTPEILGKVGFVYEDMGDDSPYDRWVCESYQELWVWDFNGEEWMVCLGYGIEQGGFHYLHQLQNLYFALTNQELTINL